jgi:hypothetical protein
MAYILLKLTLDERNFCSAMLLGKAATQNKVIHF